MERNDSYFDEQRHRGALADFRLCLDDQLNELQLGRIQRGSKQALWAKDLAEIYDQYEWLVTQTVMGGLIDVATRKSHKHLLKTINALERSLARVEGEYNEKCRAHDKLLEVLLERGKGGGSV